MGLNQSFITEWDKMPKTIMEFDRNITKESVMQTIQQMRNHQIPSIDDFCWACREATKFFRALPNHVDVTVQPNDRMILVGDMHGCFETLIRLFIGEPKTQIAPLGFPGDIVDDFRNVYLFNGDLVDRGGSGYQIVFTICLLTITCQECIYVNRGNHESEMFGMSTQPGLGHKFMFEVQEKFPQVDFLKYKQAVSELFCSFPICHTLDKNIFVVHGGVPMANDLSSMPAPSPSPFAQKVQQPISYNQMVTPYPISQLQNLNPPRFQTLDFEDSPRTKNLVWHGFLWSYDRLPYAAAFLDYNGYKTMVCSHTATPYHFVTTFLPVENQPEGFGIQSVANSQDKFEAVYQFFEQHPNLQKIKLSIVEVFSSPTNQGQLYACVIKGKNAAVGQRLDYDPLHWEYKMLGSHTEFNFVQAQPGPNGM
ncbi:Serine/threonine-protein_phosphatase [Hexamita inflata]|uniref:Serine/threonine-protein phosphatase n=1 Tax=Hexamita inflata TaxID=28002 RepID=A0AA86V3R5_9EUKA|nr:Serine/threonine-protein phosphatase [Hexamita inflata]